MSQNPIQDELLKQFEQTRQVSQDFIQSRSETQRTEIGTLKEWAAKDLLSNVACWMEYMVQRMAYFTRDETPPGQVDFDAVSERAFTAYQHRPWSEVVAYLDRSFADLVAAVQSFSDDQLMANNVYEGLAEGPLRGEISANGFIGPLQEFEKFYQRTGDTTRATKTRSILKTVLGKQEPIECNLILNSELAEQFRTGAQPIIIDVRDAKEYAAGHIQGAIHIPLAELNRKIGQLSSDKPIITYCNMHHKGASRGERAAALLTKQGFKASALDGGFPGWKAANLPTQSN